MTHPADPAATALRWLTRAAWPLWLEHGIDRARGGFHESLDLETLTCPATVRRLRVAARQVYVFAEAHRRGCPGADEAVALGIEFLRRKAALGGGAYASRLDLDGNALPGPLDLYDLSFVLLALASAASVLPAPPLRDEALALTRLLDGRFRHPRGGYRDAVPDPGPCRQNPHMHLLEACLAAAEAFGEPGFEARAAELVGLFLERFLVEGALPEVYDADLMPLREDGRFRVEPGHHCEWIWLLDWHRRRGGAASEEAVRALRGFVDRFAVNPATGTLYDGVWSDGRVEAAGSRLWPQTERLKSERLGGDAAGLARALDSVLGYLTPAGLWHERRGPDGTLSAEPAPATSLYHLTGGILFAAAP